MEHASLKLHLFRSYLWSKTASLLIGFALFFYNSGVLYSTLEKAMATYSCILAWRIPETEEPGGLPSMGSHSRTRLKWLSSSSIHSRNFPVAHTIKNLLAMQETRVWSLGQEDPLEKGMATHSSILAWRISETEEPGGLPSMGSHRVGHDWSDSSSSNC